MEGMKAGRSAGQLLGILLPQLSNNDVHNVFEHNAEVQSRSAPTTTQATNQCNNYDPSYYSVQSLQWQCNYNPSYYPWPGVT